MGGGRIGFGRNGRSNGAQVPGRHDGPCDSRERRMEQQALAIALIGVLGIGAQWVAWRTGWPGIALLLLAGVIAGPVTGLIDPEHGFGPPLEPALSIAVAVILFVGGLSLDFRSEEHTSELQSLMCISYAVFWLYKQKTPNTANAEHYTNNI